MRILITGGTGFIGQAVVRRLQRSNHQLLVLVRRRGSKGDWMKQRRTKLVFGSLDDLKAIEPTLRRFKPEVTIHLAWEGIPDYGPSMSARNLIYGIKLMEVVSRLGCKSFISSGSCWEYGAVSGKLKESDSTRPTNPFTAAKLALQLFGEQIANVSGMKFIWLRLFYVYGPGQKAVSLIPTVIDAAKSGRSPEIKNPRGGNDFVYVEDVAAAITKLVSRLGSVPGGVYNVGSGKLTKVSQIVNLACRMAGLSFRLPTLSKTAGFSADITKLSRAIGWRPAVTIEQGIKHTFKDRTKR